MLRLELTVVLIVVILGLACVAWLNTPSMFYYWPALTVDARRLPAQATLSLPPGLLNFKVVPADAKTPPQWPREVSWRLIDTRNEAAFAGTTNLAAAEDLGWRRPLQMRELSFGDGAWRSEKRLKLGEPYRLEVLSARESDDSFVIDMYYVAPIRLYDRLTCFDVCVRRRDPSRMSAADFARASESPAPVFSRE